MGARARLRDQRDRPGLGAARADRERAGRRRDRPRGPRNGARRCVLVVLLRGDRDRQEPVPEGRFGDLGPELPVRLDEPRLGARARALGADRLAVRAGRVRGRHRDDRPDGRHAAAVRLAPGRGGRPRARARSRHGPPAPHSRRAADLAPAAHQRRRVVGRRPQLPRRLADALQGDHDRLPARRVRGAARRRLLQRPLPAGLLSARAGALGGVHRPGHRRAELRLLRRQRPPPDHRTAASRSSPSTASTTGPPSRCGSPR